MTARISGLLLNGPLQSVIGGTANQPFTDFRLYKGSLPTSLLDNLSDANILSSASLGAAGGSVVIPYTSCWAAPSSGVTMLTSNLAIFIRGTGLPASPIPGFLRFYSAGTPVMDIEVSTTKGPQVAQLSSVSTVTAGQVLSLMDLKFRIATSGPVSLNNSFASAILRQMTSQTQYIAVPALASPGYMAGFPWVYSINASSGETLVVSAPIIATAYDGPIPTSANAEATGTKLWEKSYSSANGSNIWEVSGSTMGLVYTFSANASASGTPTYIRITKPEVSITGTYPGHYPRFVVQVPVGVGSGTANFTQTDFVSGQSVSLNPFTLSFMLQELV